MYKRQNDSSQIKKEEYERQTVGDYDVNEGALFNRATEEQMSGRQFIRAKRSGNRIQVNAGIGFDHNH